MQHAIDRQPGNQYRIDATGLITDRIASNGRWRALRSDLRAIVREIIHQSYAAGLDRDDASQTCLAALNDAWPVLDSIRSHYTVHDLGETSTDPAGAIAAAIARYGYRSDQERIIVACVDIIADELDAAGGLAVAR